MTSSSPFKARSLREGTRLINSIKGVVCAHYGVTVNAVDSRAKPQEVNEARQISMWISHKLCNGMVHIISKSFKRTRTSVRYTLKSVGNRIEVVKGYKDLVDMLEEKCQ
jgi:chromosomal replication initiation ATPase DnaA